MKAIILAAGYATRLYPLTKDRPKPLLKVGGKTIIEYMLANFSALPQMDTVYVVTNDKFTLNFNEWANDVNASNAFRFNVEIVNDGTTSNETRLGAIADIQFVIEQENIRDDLLVAAGDNIFQFDFSEFYRFFREKKSTVIVAQELHDPVRLTQRGVVKFDDANRVVDFQEKPQHPPSNFVCPALYIHPAEHIAHYTKYLAERNNPDAPGHFIKWLYQKVRVYAFVMSKPAIDIGTLETFERVNRELSLKRKTLSSHTTE